MDSHRNLTSFDKIQQMVIIDAENHCRGMWNIKLNWIMTIILNGKLNDRIFKCKMMIYNRF